MINFEREKIKVRERIPYVGLMPSLCNPSPSRMLLARCVDCFVEDLIMFRFVSERR